MKKLSLRVALALLLAAGLLAMAGPALADNPFAGNTPGFMWGGHEINARFYMTGEPAEDVYTYDCVASDPRISGEFVVVVEEWGDDFATGYFDLTNEDGSWHCPYWKTLYSGPQQLLLLTDAFGSGDYIGLTFRGAVHEAARGGLGPYILKGWIF